MKIDFPISLYNKSIWHFGTNQGTEVPKIAKVSFPMNDTNWNWRANWNVVVELHIEIEEIKNSIPGSVI